MEHCSSAATQGRTGSTGGASGREGKPQTAREPDRQAGEQYGIGRLRAVAGAQSADLLRCFVELHVTSGHRPQALARLNGALAQQYLPLVLYHAPHHHLGVGIVHHAAAIQKFKFGDSNRGAAAAAVGGGGGDNGGSSGSVSLLPRCAAGALAAGTLIRS